MSGMTQEEIGFTLPDCSSVLRLFGSDEGDLSWSELLDQKEMSPTFSQPMGFPANQERDAMVVYLSLLGDAIESGWGLRGTEESRQELVAPSFPDRKSRKEHIQRNLDLRFVIGVVRDEQEIAFLIFGANLYYAEHIFVVRSQTVNLR